MPRGRRRRRRGAGRRRPDTPGGPPLPNVGAPDVGGLPSREEMDTWKRADTERRGREGRSQFWGSQEARTRRGVGRAFRTGEEMAGRPTTPAPSATPGVPAPTPTPQPTPTPRRIPTPIPPQGTPTPLPLEPHPQPWTLGEADPRYQQWYDAGWRQFLRSIQPGTRSDLPWLDRPGPGDESGWQWPGWGFYGLPEPEPPLAPWQPPPLRLDFSA